MKKHPVPSHIRQANACEKKFGPAVPGRIANVSDFVGDHKFVAKKWIRYNLNRHR